MSKTATCTICGASIPAARIEAIPHTVTCSRKCGRENALRTRARAQRAWRQRQKEKKMAAAGTKAVVLALVAVLLGACVTGRPEVDFVLTTAFHALAY